MNGLLVIDKPPGITSRDAVNRAQRWFPRHTKLGHTGTLDPLATGVLVLCVGPATRLTEYVQGLPKTYETTLRLGVRSDTDDADGAVTTVDGAVVPTVAEVRTALEPFIGLVEQVPPAYSAVKTGGQRAYERARRNETVHLAVRRVRIDGIELLGYEYPHLQLRIDCGKGTYIRSIARDLGERLGCGAYVEKLRRTRVGPFTPAQAVSLDAGAAMARDRLLPPAVAVEHLPRVTLSMPEVQRLRNGQAVPALPRPGAPLPADVAVFDTSGQFVGIVGHVGTLLQPRKML